jgi:DNA-binding transcriptional ArsR family regulator
MAALENWYCVSAHGSVLVYITVHPDCTIRELTEALFLTPRTIWGLIGDLRRAGMLDARREQRANHYTVNLDAYLSYPGLKTLRLRELLGELADSVPRRTPESHARATTAQASS